MPSSTALQRGGVIVVVVAVMVLVAVCVVDVRVVDVVVVVAVVVAVVGFAPSDQEIGCTGPYDQGLTVVGWFC